MLSVSVEMCVSVTDVPPSSASVAAVKSPTVCLALTNEVRPMRNSRNAFVRADPLQRREAVDGDPVRLVLLDDPLDLDQVVLEGRDLRVGRHDLSRPSASALAKS